MYEYSTKATGKCAVCGVSVTGHKWYCDACSKVKRKEARMRWRQNMIAIGACIECGRQTNGTLLCYECTAKQSERNEKREQLLLKQCKRRGIPLQGMREKA